MFLAAVGIGAGDGFIDAIAGGGYRWIGYGVIITVLPLLLVAFIARLKFKMNYYTLMGLMAGSMTDPPALGYANHTAGNDMPVPQSARSADDGVVRRVGGCRKLQKQESVFRTPTLVFSILGSMYMPTERPISQPAVSTADAVSQIRPPL